MSNAIAGAAQVQDLMMEVVIEASRERVWEALVEQTNDWWHKDFYTGAGALGFHLQPKLGGWMFEDWGDGGGLIWGTVIGVRLHEMLQVAGDSSPDWGGPNRGIMAWTLAPADGREDVTVVRFRHSFHGHASDSTRTSLDDGWRMLFEGCLKPFAEAGARPNKSKA